MQQIQYIETNQLQESSMNPRKEFDMEGIEELAESIKQVGILQPIIARLNTSVQKYDIPTFEVICGSRRLSAAVIADLKEVPVIVRDLSDEEAFDLMITENLQRKDVSPLEEALAFQSLINKGKYDYNSLSDRFGKSVTYIRQRVKLNDLIYNFGQLLQQDIITVSHAFEISKLESVYQMEIFNTDFEDRKQYWSCPTVKNLKQMIEKRFTLKLSEAQFNLEDLSLNSKAGSCTICPKNTSSNLLLFPDAPESGLCLDRDCFKKKSDIHFEREMNRIQEEQPEIILGIPSYIYNEEEKQVESLKNRGVPVVEMSWSNGFQKVFAPEPPEQPKREDFDSVEEFNDALYDYESELEEYNENLEDYNKKVSKGNLRKVFMTVGTDRGKIFEYEITGTGKSEKAIDGEAGNQRQIIELQAKDKRNTEIAFEKTYADAKELLSEKTYSNIETELTLTEWHAVYIALIDYLGYVPLREEINPKSKGYIDNKDKAEIASSLDANQINRLFRAFLQKKFDTSNPLYLISEANALISIAAESFPEELKEIELKHQGVYLNRKEKINSKIQELQK